MVYVQQRYGQYGDWLSDAIGYVRDALPVVQQIASGGPAPTAGGGTVTKAAYPAAPAPPSFSPGGFVEKNQTLLLLGAAGLLVFLMIGRKK